MNEQDYQLLIDLYETKNITKVADQHFLTQPALTKRLRRIEEELGSVLLVRSRKGVVFNSVGESVISYCRQMCEMNEQLRNSINASKGIVGGSFPSAHPSTTAATVFRVSCGLTRKNIQWSISASPPVTVRRCSGSSRKENFPSRSSAENIPGRKDGSFSLPSRSVSSAAGRTLTGILRNIPISATVQTLMKKIV